MLEQLLKDHDQLRATAASLRALLDCDAQPVGDELAARRWSLTRQMLRHIALENAAMATKGEDAFVRHYRDHVATWTTDKIRNQWRAFRQELTAILDTLEQRMDREEREFYRPRLRQPAVRAAAPSRH